VAKEAKPREVEPLKPGAVPSFLRAHSGPFTLSLYRRILERIQETGAVLTLSVSSGVDERVFFFTRGAILFLATGSSGGHLLERKIIARGLVPAEKLQSLRSVPGKERPILQEVLREERLVEDAQVQGLVNELIEEQLLEVALWDNEVAVYDIIPGNPPPRLYDKNAPSIRLSFGLRALLAALIPKVAEIPEKILKPLGGSLKQRVKLTGSATEPTGDPVQDALLKHVAAQGRPALQILAAAQRAGIPSYRGAIALGALVEKRRAQVEGARELTPEEQAQVAATIENSLDNFVNRLIARQHLATIYEKLDDRERAGDHLREIATEYVERDRIDDALDSLQKALGLAPKDIAAREGLVKALTLAKRPTDASKEAMNLGQMLLELALPGRAKNAFTLAAKLVPRSLEILWKLASLSESLGDKDEAIRRYEEIAEVARIANDKVGVVSAKQRILVLDPKNKVALKAVRKLSGYASALFLRIGVAGAAVVASAVVASTSFYELSATRALRATRDQAWVAFDAGKVEGARSLAKTFAREWPHSRASLEVDGLLSQLDREDRLSWTLDVTREERTARALEDDGRAPEAVSHWQAAVDACHDPERRSSLGASLARCQAILGDAASSRARASALRDQGDPLRARDLLVAAAAQFPWLGKSGTFYVPCRIESVPSGLHVSVDGRALESTTPVTVDRALAPGRVVVTGEHGETASRDLPATPPWPVVLGLPRPSLWQRPEVTAVAAPVVLADGRLVVAGRDRAVTVLQRETGAVVWRHSLGLFGDVSAAPALVDRLIVARTSDGTVVALDAARGAERWRAAVARAPDDAAARPVATPAGVAVREGSRNLVLLRTSNGGVAWRVKLAEDLIGPPLAVNDVVVLAHGRTLVALDAKKGSVAWETQLPAPAVLGPALGPRGTIYVPLAGQLARASIAGGLIEEEDAVRDPLTAIEADEQHVVLGTAAGEVMTLDTRGKVARRARVSPEHAVTWVYVTTGLVLASNGSELVALDQRLAERWRDLTTVGAASADPTHVFLVGPRGLAACPR
jgi:outer membrane protein assembly factor BamB/tetratricopeptide (TPR) repeat protein